MRSSVLFLLAAANPVDGAERERVAASAGPEAVKAALEGELKEAEKFHDTEHEKSILQHWVDYSHEAIPGKDGVPLAVMRQREAAEIDAKNGNSAATDAALAFQYKLAEIDAKN